GLRLAGPRPLRGRGPAAVGPPATLAARPPGRAGDHHVRLRRGAVRGARARHAAVAVAADPAARSGDRRLADQPGGGCDPRAVRAGRTPAAARRPRIHPPPPPPAPSAPPLPASVR